MAVTGNTLVQVQFVKSGFRNAQHSRTPELCFVNRYLAQLTAVDAMLKNGYQDRHEANNKPGTINDAFRHLRRAPSNAMSAVNPTALATLHSQHAYCTDQSYMLGTGSLASTGQRTTLCMGLQRSCSEGVADDWLLSQTQDACTNILVFKSAVITTVTGANLVTSATYHRNRNREDNHVLINYVEDGERVVQYVATVLFFARVASRNNDNSLDATYVAVVTQGLATPVVGPREGRCRMFRYNHMIPSNRLAYTVPVDLLTAKVCTASDNTWIEGVPCYAMEVSTTSHMR